MDETLTDRIGNQTEQPMNFNEQQSDLFRLNYDVKSDAPPRMTFGVSPKDVEPSTPTPDH